MQVKGASVDWGLVLLFNPRDALGPIGFIPVEPMILHYIERPHFGGPPPGSPRWRQ